MDVVLWGVRGSIPSPSVANQFYGANTPCIELRTTGGDILIFDAGSGIRPLGETLPEKGECHLFITHGHTDHTAGLGFFKPFFSSDWTIHLYLPEEQEGLLKRYFDGATFPVHHSELKADIRTTIVKGGETLTLATKNKPIIVETLETNHPGGNVAFRVYADKSTFLYSGDHEITDDPAVRDVTRNMLMHTDLALVDASFSRDDLIPGWGHSAWEDWLECARGTEAKCLVFTHHSPDKTDSQLDALQRKLTALPDEGIRMCVAREGMRFSPDMGVLPDVYTSDWLQEFIDTLCQYKEESVLLDTILKKTREVSFADAGTVFLLDDDELVFSYTHNDSLFPSNESSKHAYVSIRLPCSIDSIAGYVAVTRKSLNLPDVRHLPEGAPYSFNESFDNKTGYRTISTLTIPLIGKNNRLMGVLQLINSLNPRDKQPQPFTDDMEKTVRILAMEASKVLEISSTITDNIYRLLSIASLHDPMETGPHAERVGAISAEIYQAWALKHRIAPDEALNFRSHLRLAAMLHDIGKVGISDSVLKKPGKLTEEEFDYIKTHTAKGSALFDSQPQDISELAHDISLHHHQKWNGTGYGEMGKPPLSGRDIPLAARITAIADVFDALVSPRCYKDPWPVETAIALIKQEAGSHFDPELVDCFISILDTVQMIYERFPESLPFSFPAYQIPGVRCPSGSK